MDVKDQKVVLWLLVRTSLFWSLRHPGKAEGPSAVMSQQTNLPWLCFHMLAFPGPLWHCLSQRAAICDARCTDSTVTKTRGREDHIGPVNKHGSGGLVSSVHADWVSLTKSSKTHWKQYTERTSPVSCFLSKVHLHLLVIASSESLIMISELSCLT